MVDSQGQIPFPDFADSDRREAYDRIYPEPSVKTRECFDPEIAREARDAAIAQVDANANPEWREVFYAALERVAARCPEFCADDIWEELSKLPDVPKQKEGRAAGAIIVKAIKNNVIKPKPNCFQKSRRASCHFRPITVYESLVFEG